MTVSLLHPLHTGVGDLISNDDMQPEYQNRPVGAVVSFAMRNPDLINLPDGSYPPSRGVEFFAAVTFKRIDAGWLRIK